MRPLMRYPVMGTEAFPWDNQPERKWRAAHGPCGICGEYEGIHPRCWWYWLTDERVIRGAWDGEQQIEPDEPWPSRIRIVWVGTKMLFDLRWWKLCWDERIFPWPYGQ